MKPILSRFLIVLLAIAILLFPFTNPTDAQPPDPETIQDNGEYLPDLSSFEQVIIERDPITVEGDNNSINAATSWWSLSGTVFVPSTSAITYYYGGGGCVATGSNSDFWRGSVNLPHGSTINSMWFNYDNEIVNPTYSTIILRRYSYFGEYSDIIEIDGVVDDLGFQSSLGYATTNNVVDNVNYTYVLLWYGKNSQNLCGVNLSFTPPPIFLSALPIINK